MDNSQIYEDVKFYVDEITVPIEYFQNKNDTWLSIYKNKNSSDIEKNIYSKLDIENGLYGTKNNDIIDKYFDARRYKQSNGDIYSVSFDAFKKFFNIKKFINDLGSTYLIKYEMIDLIEEDIDYIIDDIGYSAEINLKSESLQYDVGSMKISFSEDEYMRIVEQIVSATADSEMDDEVQLAISGIEEIDNKYSKNLIKLRDELIDSFMR